MGEAPAGLLESVLGLLWVVFGAKAPSLGSGFQTILVLCPRPESVAEPKTKIAVLSGLEGGWRVGHLERTWKP